VTNLGPAASVTTNTSSSLSGGQLVYTFATLPAASSLPIGTQATTSDKGVVFNNGTYWVPLVQNGPISIAAIGDSIVARMQGNDISSGGNIVAASYLASTRAHFARSWIAYGAMRSSFAWYPFDYSVGFAGGTSSNVLASCVPALLNYPFGLPDMCVVLAGTNDNGQNYSLATTGANLKAIYTALLAAGITPIACTIPPPTNNFYNAQLMNEMIIRIAKEFRIPVVDFYTSLANLATGGWVNANYTDDTTHPSPLGCSVMGYTLNQAIMQYLRPLQRSMMPLSLDFTTTVTATVGISAGATSCTLNAGFAGSSGPYTFQFSSGDVHFGTLTNGSTACSWSGAMANSATSTITVWPGFQNFTSQMQSIVGTINTASSYPSVYWGAPGTPAMSTVFNGSGTEPGTGLTMLQQSPAIAGLSPVYAGNSWSIAGNAVNTFTSNGPAFPANAGDRLAIAFRIKLIMGTGNASPGTAQFFLASGGRQCAGFCYIPNGVNYTSAASGQIGNETGYVAGDFYQEIIVQSQDAPKLIPVFTLNTQAGGSTNSGDSVTIASLRVWNLTQAGMVARRRAARPIRAIR
jgi:lysophospholipase L1-like esterase